MASSRTHSQFSLLAFAAVLSAVRGTTQVDDGCPLGLEQRQLGAARAKADVLELPDSDIHGLLQTFSRSGAQVDRDGQPSADRGADLRAQIRALGGLCGQDMPAKFGSTCPEECPLTTRDFSDPGADFCTFACVPATEAACVAYSLGEPIPDETLGICRAPTLKGCTAFVEPSATMSASELSRCLTCSAGYRLLHDGSCESIFRFVWLSIFVVAGLLICIVIGWMRDLSKRPLINTTGLEHGLATRSRAKLHTPKERDAPQRFKEEGTLSASQTADGDASGRKLWPVLTNLCRTVVAGPGLTLHFNFQAMLILWASTIMIAWVLFAVTVDKTGQHVLFKIGMLGAVTPAQTCEVEGWGHEMQEKFKWARATFVVGCYAFSFALFIVFGICQLRLFQSLDERETTHMDFCAILEGLPKMDGSDEVEEELCYEIKKAFGHKPVGVSIAWDMEAMHQDLMNVIDEHLDALHDEQVASYNVDSGTMRALHVRRETRDNLMLLSEDDLRKLQGKKPKKNTPTAKAASNLKAGFRQVAGVVTQPLAAMRADSRCPDFLQASEDAGLFRCTLLAVERCFLSSTTQIVLSKGRRRDFGGRHTDEDACRDDFDVEEELQRMRSCSTAFAVFESEEARDAVIEAAKIDGFHFRGQEVKLHEAHHEPDSVFWANFNDQHHAARVGLGILTIIAALAFWTLVFYLPYAWYYMSFNYAHGQLPGALEEMTFMIMVLVGNASMYFLCSEVADRCKFRFVGDRELCYVLMYYTACTLNVVLDLVCAYQVAYMALVGVGSRIPDGTLLSDVSSFTERFGSYPMQRDLGFTVFLYAFPSTFLVPFLAEPVFTIFLPYKIMVAIVGYRPDIQGCRADAFLACAPMDLSRYADVALNTLLGTLVFWFPSGLTLWMFAACTLSHVYIYCYDQYRVLRAVPACSFSSMRTDLWAQAMLAVPCGLLLSCAFYKANCVEGLERFHPEGVFGHCKQYEQLVLKCCAAFAAHVALHLLLLGLVVPLFGRLSKERTKTPYEECARRLPHSYFSTNPVHCLRSEFIYEHDPPFVFSRSGKEHLMPRNVEIGAYFCDASVSCEDFSGSVESLEGLQSMATMLRDPRRPSLHDLRTSVLSIPQLTKRGSVVSGKIDESSPLSSAKSE